MAGLGRRLANEMCHRAKLSPFADTAKLDGGRGRRLSEAIARVHRRVARLRAQPRRHELVEGAAGRGAPPRPARPARCAATRSVPSSTARYTVNYCATCQTGGKVLADNTTSKFLK